MTITCYRCGKPIMGRVINTNPSNLARSLGDFPKAFHSICYGKVEAEARKALQQAANAALARLPSVIKIKPFKGSKS